jgi:predicted nucleic acid-binding protein
LKIFFDSSAFAKRFVDEDGTDRVEALCQEADELGLSVLCAPEVASAMNRRVREKGLTRSEYIEIKKRIAKDVRDASIINLIPSVIQASIDILEASPVRTLDALHIACASEWGADSFVTADKRQIAAARKVGLRTKQV